MPPDIDAVQRWAAAHAATVSTAGSLTARNHPTTPPRQTSQPVPAVLASITQTRTWRTESEALGVSVSAATGGRGLLAVGEVNGAVRIWDPGTGELLRSLTGHTDAVLAVDLGHDRDGQRLLASGSNDGTVRIWDPLTGELVNGSPSFAGRGPIAKVSWGHSADGQTLLAIGVNDGAWIWDPETGDTVHAVTYEDRSSTVSWCAGHHSELLLAAAGPDQTVRIYDAGTGQTMHVLTEHEQVRTVALARRTDGSLMFATIGWRQSAQAAETALTLWREHRDGAFTAESVELSQGPLRTVLWIPLPDGRTLLAGCSEGSLFVVDGSTRELLHTQPVDFAGRGLHNLGWAVAPDGSLMLCGTSNPDHVHVWTLVLDPPIPVPTSGSSIAGGRPTASPHPTPRPIAVVLASITETRTWRTESHACGASAWTAPDGRILLAVGEGSGGSVRIWDPGTGELLRTLTGQTNDVFKVDWGHDRDGRPLLATASYAGMVRIWDTQTGELVNGLPSFNGRVGPVSWGYSADGQTLLAIGADDGAWIWDPETGDTVHAVTEGRVSTVSWGAGHHSELLLAAAGGDQTVRIYNAGTGQTMHVLTEHDRVRAVAWARRTGESLMFATVGWRPSTQAGETALTLWREHRDDAFTAESVELSQGQLRTVLWIPLPDGRTLLAGCSEDSLFILDGSTRELLHTQRVDFAGRGLHNFGWAVAPDGNLVLCFTSNPDHVHVWRITLDPPIRVPASGHLASSRGQAIAGGADASPEGALGTHQVGMHQAGWLAGRLLCLGDGGLWPPLGLLADLVTLTGPAAAVQPRALCDARLAALTGEPGIGRLRDLAAGDPGWAPAARVTLAALLASTLDIPEQYIPPPGAGITSLADALAGILSARTTPRAARPWQVPVADVRTAAAAITGQTLTLLRILGPDACAADPMLPLRLAHHVPQLPVLSSRELRLLTGAAGRRTVNGQAAAAGTLVYSPGTAGITRSGPPTRLLPTELALPRDLLAVRLAETQLLYRQHRAPVPPAPEPVTIILDTTPPTFGPAGQALRLAVHLIAVTLWDHDRYPSLITLTSPATITELRTPADLVSVWASATLEDPLPALATARTAASALTGQPAVLCTHHHTARGTYAPGPATRLLTAHQPPEQPPRPPASPWHAHLPPTPTPVQLTTAIAQLLTPSTQDRA